MYGEPTLPQQPPPEIKVVEKNKEITVLMEKQDYLIQLLAEATDILTTTIRRVCCPIDCEQTKKEEGLFKTELGDMIAKNNERIKTITTRIKATINSVEL